MKADICRMYLHASGMLCATPGQLLGEQCLLDMNTFPKVGYHIGRARRENERIQECPLYQKMEAIV